jgi:hypothetical protein
MEDRFRMRIKDMFSFSDGRTVLIGSLEGGENVIIRPGPCDVYLGDRKVQTIQIEPEMIPQRSNPLEFHSMRAVSTLDKISITKDLVASKICRLEGPMAVYGHRHLLGIDSPPDDYVPDDMTLGPRLPEGWDGDAWTQPGGGGHFLRAWHKPTGRYAIGTGSKYEEARQRLLEDIKSGSRRALVNVTERTG